MAASSSRGATGHDPALKRYGPNWAVQTGLELPSSTHPSQGYEVGDLCPPHWPLPPAGSHRRRGHIVSC